MAGGFLFATYNIQYGKGADGTYDLDRIARDVAAADIVAFQEVTQHWRRTGGIDQAAWIAERLGLHYVFGAAYDVDASTVATDGKAVHRRRTFGNMVASRWPIRATRTILLPKKPLHRVFDIHRSATEALIATPIGPMRVYSVHLSHLNSAQRLPQIAALREAVARAPVEGAAWDHPHRRADWNEDSEPPHLPEPAIVAGDFNCDWRSPDYAEICGELDPRTGRMTRNEQWLDSWTLAGKREDDGTSHFGEQRRIDYAFVTPSLADRVKESWIDTQARGSDHFPVFVRFGT